MQFFFSGEIQADVYEDFAMIQHNIELLVRTLEVNDYGSEVKEIGIIPILMNQKGESAEYMRKERRLLNKNGEADYRLFIDYEKFLVGDYSIKRLLIIKNLLECIRQIGVKVKKGFDAQKLENDILHIMSLSANDINEV